MKILLVGLGRIGLGLIAPIFQKAGYQVVGTDADTVRVKEVGRGYCLETPHVLAKYKLPTMPMDQVGSGYNAVIVCVGRNHLPEVRAWYERMGLSAPILLAENLPDPVNLFPHQIQG